MDPNIRLDPSIRSLEDLGALREPMLIAGFGGVGNESPAATVAYLAGVWGARPVAHVDPDAFYDFTVARPLVSVINGERVVDWPTVEFWLARPTGIDRDILLLAGLEPHMRWQRFIAGIIEVGRAVGLTEALVLGAYPAAIPHTRRAPAVMYGTGGSFASRAGIEAVTPDYEGPITVGMALAASLGDAGVPAAGLVAVAPFYLKVNPSPHAMAALIDAIDQGLGTDTPREQIESCLQAVDAQAAAALEGSPEMTQVVASLEEQHDAIHETQTMPAPELRPDEVVADVEALLNRAHGQTGGR